VTNQTDAGFAARFPALDPDCARILDAAADAGVAPIFDITPAELRERTAVGNALCAKGPDLRAVVDGVLGDGIGVRRYLPHELRTDVVVVWFHGGGWTTGDLDHANGFCRLLAADLGVVVCSVDYRLAPEHPFPAAIDDAIAAVREIAADGPVIAAGDSAGGNLAAVCVQELGRELDIRGQLLVYPALDTDVSRPSYTHNDGLILGPREMSWFFDNYLPDRADRGLPRAAPLHAKSLTGLPPAVIAVASLDPLYDEGCDYAERLREADVQVTVLEFPSLVHGFLRFTELVPAAADAAQRIVASAATLLDY
jgi:acetyl esterase